MEVKALPKKAKEVILSEVEQMKLQKLSNSQKEEARLVQRAKAVLGCAQGRSISEIGRTLGMEPETVIKWRNRYLKEGITGLRDKTREGRPKQYGAEFEQKVLETLNQPAPNGQASWDGPTLAKQLNTSVDAVWRCLKKHGIQLARKRSWCISTDPFFAAKAADIVGLYINPTDKAIVIAVDEKPMIQALERKRGYITTRNHKIIQGLQSTYKRHGTINLFAALEVMTGQIRGKTTYEKKRVDFLELIEQVVQGYGSEQEIHVIMDNHSIHKGVEKWLEDHPNVCFHYTPTSMSWVNTVEIWFGIFTLNVLRNSSFTSVEYMVRKIMKYPEAHGEDAPPFIWKKKVVVGTQLVDDITNLCE